MTVREAIEALSSLDPDLVLYVCVKDRPYQPVDGVLLDEDRDGAVALISIEEEE